MNDYQLIKYRSLRLRHCVVSDEGDTLFRDLKESSCECRGLLKAGEKILATWPELLEDLFWCFYLPHAVLREEMALGNSFVFNLWLLKGFMETAEYSAFRSLTKDSMYGSGLATLNTGWFLLEHLDREVIDLVNKLFHWENEAYLAKLHYLSWEKIIAVDFLAAQRKNPEFVSTRDSWRAQERECRAQAINLKTALVDLLLQMDPPARFDPAQRDKVKKEITQGKLAEGAWGTYSSRWDKKSFQDRQGLFEKLNRSAKLKRLMERLGRMRKVRATVQPGRDSFPAELWGLETGNDLERLLPEEALGFTRPRWKKLFYRNFIEGALSLYRYHRAEEKRKGPMLICIDNSGSMQGAKEDVSKILAFSVADIAARDKRDLTILMFGGPGDEIKVFEAPAGNFEASDKVAMAECFLCSSGTDYSQPLEKALEYLQKHRYTKGDIIFISDGICRLDSASLLRFRQAKKRLGFKTTCIVIHYGKFTPDGVADFGDEILISKDLLGHDVAPVLWSHFG